MNAEKTIKITAPSGYEIDRSKSTLEEIVFKPIEPVKEKYPMSVKEIYDRKFYFINGGIEEAVDFDRSLELVKTRELASAFLALMQLKTICDEWNRIDGFVPDWSSGKGWNFCITFRKQEFQIHEWSEFHYPLAFKDQATAQLFLDSFKEMIETAKPLL
jgi:hypothetical protein